MPSRRLLGCFREHERNANLESLISWYSPVVDDVTYNIYRSSVTFTRGMVERAWHETGT